MISCVRQADKRIYEIVKRMIVVVARVVLPHTDSEELTYRVINHSSKPRRLSRILCTASW
jgi:hypothetical protein